MTFPFYPRLTGLVNAGGQVDEHSTPGLGVCCLTVYIG
jgi:hypothetical protein